MLAALSRFGARIVRSTNAATGQLRTRFQAFIESLEIKRIQSGREGV